MPQTNATIGYPVQKLVDKMRSLELVGRVYNPSAKYLKHRRVLVDWLCEVGEDTRLAMSTVHCAVAYMDAFLQRMEVHRSRLQLVAMAALDIAAKYEEAEERVPSADVLNASANHSYPPHMLHQMSVLILNRCSREGRGLLTRAQRHVVRCMQAGLDAHGCDSPTLSGRLPRRGARRELLLLECHLHHRISVSTGFALCRRHDWQATCVYPHCTLRRKIHGLFCRPGLARLWFLRVPPICTRRCHRLRSTQSPRDQVSNATGVLKSRSDQVFLLTQTPVEYRAQCSSQLRLERRERHF